MAKWKKTSIKGRSTPTSYQKGYPYHKEGVSCSYKNYEPTIRYQKGLIV